MARVGGVINLKVNGAFYKAKGNFTYNLGGVKRDGVVGADAVHGFKDMVQVPFIEGEITDDPNLDLQALQATTGATVTLELAVGKVIVLRDAWYSSEGTGNTEEGNIGFRFEGMSGEEVR